MVPALVLCTVLAGAGPAIAQSSDAPIGPFVIDVRGALVPFGQDPTIAAHIGVLPTDMPKLGLGLNVGGHWYFLRWKAITFGVGALLHMSSAEHQRPADSELGIVVGPLIRTAIRTVVPQLSFNFGGRDGWSYLSGGISNVRLNLTKNGVEQPTVPTQTINYGGGARWFVKPHLAFNLDLRFYAMNPVPAAVDAIGQPRMTIMAFSAGVSIK